jgi:hypothetical protein
MKRTIQMCLGLTLLAIGACSQPAPPPAAAPAPAPAPAVDRAAIEPQILANERAINEAVATSSVEKFKSLVDERGFGIDPTGVMSIGDYEKMVSAIKVESWEMSDQRYLWLSDDAVLIAYKWTGKGTFMGMPVPSPTLASTIWKKQADGRWLATFHQESAVMEMPKH